MEAFQRNAFQNDAFQALVKWLEVIGSHLVTIPMTLVARPAIGITLSEKDNE